MKFCKDRNLLQSKRIKSKIRLKIYLKVIKQVSYCIEKFYEKNEKL